MEDELFGELESEAGVVTVEDLRNLSSFDGVFPSSWIGDSPARLDVLWDDTERFPDKQGESFSRETSVSLPSVVLDASFRYSRELLGSKSMATLAEKFWPLVAFGVT